MIKSLQELKERCDSAKIPYAYGKFDEITMPPHLVAITTSTENFMGDDKVYVKKIPIKLDYTYDYKNTRIENLIENEILGDVAWNKTEETYLEDENCWQVSYFFDIINNN